MNIYENFSLSEILFYQIGGKARYVLKIQNMDDVKEALEFIRANAISRVLPVGLGANLLMSDKFFDGAVLWFAKPDEQLIKINEDGVIEVFASHLLEDVIQFSFRNKLIGLEWAGGLPSTVGGAIRGNVGAFGNEIGQIVEKVAAIDTSKDTFEISYLTKEELDFHYRSSVIKEKPNLLIVNAFLKLQETDEQAVGNAQNTYFENITHRKKNNPIEYPSCGSTFKNIVEKNRVQEMLTVWPDMKNQVDAAWHGKVSMGYVIRRLGLSGMTIGRGQVSEKHSNYLINLGGASFDDIYNLLQKVKETFYKTFGFYPEPEVQIIQ